MSNIVLARLLMPEDYGCIGMLTIFIVISNALIHGGFVSALI
ncbi:oligosaccharide flippase family protein [Bacteroides pyogenes]